MVGRPVRESDVKGHHYLSSMSALVQRSVTIEHLSSRTKIRHCLASRRAATSLGIKQKRNVQRAAALLAALEQR